MPLAKDIQAASEYSLWVGIPEFTIDVPLEVTLGSGIDRIIKQMNTSGMNTSTTFFAAHSLSGIALQKYLADNKRDGASGQLLMGSFLQRRYQNETYPIPTLIINISGELDSVCRVTRIMESYYNRTVYNPETFPTVVIRGMSHFQFASGEPPLLVKDFDLKPEISYNDAHNNISFVVDAFISASLGNSTSRTALKALVNDTGTFLEPILKAYEKEGFYNFKPPCYENPPSPACTVGCPWTEVSVASMGGSRVPNVNDADAFHPADEIFPAIHHPKITGTCSAPLPSCVVNLTSVSQNIYEELDKADTGLVATSASEIRGKMKSRQAMMEAAGISNVSFNTSDNFSICRMINMQAYTWAMSIADSRTVTRFYQYGVPMVMGEDLGPYNNGAIWIWTPLRYTDAKNSTGGDIVEIRSGTLRTPIDYILKGFAGMHFCKLLSPARVTEWIYVDGLRAHYSI